jgi:heme oxygenase (biliverdin-IX-beta and delta-forming)
MILKELKEATRERHAALERQLPLLSDELSVVAYRQFTRRFLGFYAQLESSLLGSPLWESLGFDYAGRHKTSRLRQDLVAMGDSLEAIDQLTCCKDLPRLDSSSRILGCLYVIEGAAFGGQIISKHLHSNLGITRETGGSFFNGYGAQTGAQWLRFCGWVRSQAEFAT